MDLEDLEYVLGTIKLLGSKGTTGTQASFLELFDGDQETIDKIDPMIAQKMGFKACYPVSGQTYSRKVDTRVANILAGMEAGFTQFDSSFAGVGGCPFVPGAAGNVATEDALHMCEQMKVETGIDLDKAMNISRRVVEILGHNTDSYLLRAGKASDLIRELPTGQIKNQTELKK